MANNESSCGRKTKLNRLRLETRIAEVYGSIENFLRDRSSSLHKNTRREIIKNAEIRETEGRTKLAPKLNVSWEYLTHQPDASRDFDDQAVNVLRERAERDLITGRDCQSLHDFDEEFRGEEWLSGVASLLGRLQDHVALSTVVNSTLDLLVRDGLLDHGIIDPSAYRLHAYSKGEIEDIAMDRIEYETVLLKKSLDNLRQLSIEGRKALNMEASSLIISGEQRVRRGLSFREYDHAFHRLIIGVGRPHEITIKFIDTIEHNDRPYMTFRRMLKRHYGASSQQYGAEIESFNLKQLGDHKEIKQEMFRQQGPRITCLKELLTHHAMRSVWLWEESETMRCQLRSHFNG